MNSDSKTHDTGTYNGDIVAGSLLITESRKIAGLLLKQANDDEWHNAIVIDNILQKRSPVAAKRQARLIRNRLILMEPDLWKIVHRGKNEVSIQALLAAAIKHSRLLGNFMSQVVLDNWRTFKPKINVKDWKYFFETCSIAEIEKISRDQIDNHYDKIETKMLDEFYDFVQNHQDHYWLHWNMENINYGFETIEHGYRVLTSKIPPKVDDSRRYNLSALVAAIYGNNYVDHPKMPNLMEINKGKPREFLTGKEEVDAFERKEYIKLHKSTMCKVYFFKSVFYKLKNRKLKTKRSNLPAKINRLVESPIAKVLGLIAVLYSIFLIGVSGYNYYSSRNKAVDKQTLEEIEINKADNNDSKG